MLRTAEDLDLSLLELQAVHLTNLKREAHGLPPLRANRRITEAARWFARDATEHDICGHQSSDGAWAGDRGGEQGRVGRFGFVGLYGAENMYCGFGTPQEAVDALYNEVPPDDGHRLNILDPRSTEIGIGYHHDGSGGGRMVQDFGRDAGYAPLVVEREAPWMDRRDVDLYIHSIEAVPGLGGTEQVMGPVREMQISDRFDAWPREWEPYTPRLTWRLSPGEGVKHVFARLRAASGATMIVGDSIVLADEAPSGIDHAALGATNTASVILPLGPPPEARMHLGPWQVLDEGNIGLHYGRGEVVPDAQAHGGTAYRLDGLDPEVPCESWAYLMEMSEEFPARRPVQVVARLRAEGGRPGEAAAKLTQVVNGVWDDRWLTPEDFPPDGRYLEVVFDVEHAGDPGSHPTWLFCEGVAATVFVDDVRIVDVVAARESLEWRPPDGNYRGQGVAVEYVDNRGTVTSAVVCYAPLPGTPGEAFCEPVGGASPVPTPVPTPGPSVLLPALLDEWPLAGGPAIVGRIPGRRTSGPIAHHDRGHR